MPSADDCPKCNNKYQGGRSYKKPHFSDEPCGSMMMGRRERTPIHDWLGGNVSVHDRLGAELCFAIVLETEYLHMIGWNKWPMTGYLMVSRCIEILRGNRFCIKPVSLDGALQV